MGGNSSVEGCEEKVTGGHEEEHPTAVVAMCSWCGFRDCIRMNNRLDVCGPWCGRFKEAVETSPEKGKVTLPLFVEDCSLAITGMKKRGYTVDTHVKNNGIAAEFVYEKVKQYEENCKVSLEDAKNEYDLLYNALQGTDRVPATDA